MASATGSFVALGLLERRPADVLHHDVADRVAVLVLVLDEVVDLHDPGVRHLGEELPLGHRDGLRLGVAGMHQALEHDRPFVDVVSNARYTQPRPPWAMQPLISYWSATLSLGLSCGRNEYALPQCGHQPSDSAWPSGVTGRPGVPQFQQNRFDSATTGLVISAASGSFAGTRGISTRPPPRRRVGDSIRVTVVACSSGSVSPVPTEMLAGILVEIRPEHRLGGHRPHRRHRVDAEVRRLGADVLVGVVDALATVACRLRRR